MIVNLNQTPSKFVQSSRQTMTIKKGIANVEIVGSVDKQSITATFVVMLDGRFLPMSLIYDGKIRSIPHVGFPSSSLSANPKYFSNKDKSVQIIKEILPYFKSQRKELGLDENFPVLLILDIFRSHIVGGEKNSVCEYSKQHDSLVATT